MTRTLNIAHQGFSSRYPSCTFPAFQAAIELGVDLVEMDLHLSKDGEIVVIHDGVVDRTTNGKGAVADLTLAQLKALDAGSWFDKKFSGVTIPTLEEVIPLFRSVETRMCLEIKPTAEGGRYEGIEKKLITMLQSHQMIERVVVTSFNGEVLREIKALEPRIPTSYDPSEVEYAEYSPAQLCQLVLARHGHILSCRYEVISDKLMRESRLVGVPVWAWTVNDPQEMRRLISLGVDAILSDHPDVLQAILMNRVRT